MGYLYDTDEEISLLSSELLEKPIDSDELFSQKPFISRFKVRPLYSCDRKTCDPLRWFALSL